MGSISSLLHNLTLKLVFFNNKTFTDTDMVTDVIN